MRRKFPEELHFSGVANHAYDKDSVDRPLQAGRYHVPAWVELDGDRLVWIPHWAWLHSVWRHGPRMKPGISEDMIDKLPMEQVWRREDIPKVMELADRSLRGIKPPSDLLTRFIGLRDGSPGDVLNFARKWGVLNFCKHAIPGGCRDPKCGPQKVEPAHRGEREKYWEHVGGWRALAEQATRILKIASRLHQGQPGNNEDLRALWPRDDNLWPEDENLWLEKQRRYAEFQCVTYHETDENGKPKLGLTPKQTFDAERALRIKRAAHSVPYQARNLADFINAKIALEGRVHPQIDWGNLNPESGGTPTFVFSGLGLWGAILVQLALAAAASDGVVVCSSCGAPYAPSRRPDPNRRNYCPKCRSNGAPKRDAARDYYSRKKQRRNNGS